MKLGIMQPYFFPYIGYFQLINSVDKWVVFDNVQYIYHGWINRNRILHPSREDWQYIIIPINKHNRNDNINEIIVSDDQDWRNRIIRQLEHYKKLAPYYNETLQLVNECLCTEEKYLARFNVRIFELICSRLNISFLYQYSSELNINLEKIQEPGDWALNISHDLNASEYINPIGGKDIFNKEKFDNYCIELKFLKPKEIRYNQKNKQFITDLSIIDILMFNDTVKIREMLNQFELSQ
ncbi:MAG: glycine transferase [Ignavibacteriae bacterium]|nr:MAG: glycine transferase [Ignavibacteriota bacterium]